METNTASEIPTSFGAPSAPAALAPSLVADVPTSPAALTDAERKRAAHERALAEAPALSPAEIVRKRPRATRWVLVPNLGGKVLVRALSGTERDAFESSLVIQRGKTRTMSTANVRAKLCALAIVDPQYYPGELRQAFDEDQIAELGQVDAGDLSKIYDAAAELSGISEADVEELAGNSNPVASAGSSSKSR